MHLFSSLVNVMLNFVVSIAKHFGVRGILILILIIEIPVTATICADISNSYKYDSHYVLSPKSKLQAAGKKEVKPYLDEYEPDDMEYYTYQLEIQNVYYEELSSYPALHQVQDTNLGQTSIHYFVTHDYQKYYYDIPEDYREKWFCQEVIPAYATLTLPCVLSADFYDLSEEEKEEVEIALEPLVDEPTEDNVITLPLPR